MKTQLESLGHLPAASRRKAQPAANGTSLVSRTGEQKSNGNFDLSTILVPVDFSAGSLGALGFGVASARRLGASIILVHVMDPMYVSGRFDSKRLRALRTEAHHEAKRLLATLAKRRVRPQVPVRNYLLEGTAYSAIVGMAAKTNTDLIVMGSEGRSGMKRFLVGSVAEKVIRHARCPVLVVRRPRRGGTLKTMSKSA